MPLVAVDISDPTEAERELADANRRLAREPEVPAAVRGLVRDFAEGLADPDEADWAHVDPYLVVALQQAAMGALLALDCDDPREERRRLRLRLEQMRQVFRDVAAGQPVDEARPADEVARWLVQTLDVPQGQAGPAARRGGQDAAALGVGERRHPALRRGRAAAAGGRPAGQPAASRPDRARGGGVVRAARGSSWRAGPPPSCWTTSRPSRSWPRWPRPRAPAWPPDGGRAGRLPPGGVGHAVLGPAQPARGPLQRGRRELHPVPEPPPAHAVGGVHAQRGDRGRRGRRGGTAAAVGGAGRAGRGAPARELRLGRRSGGSSRRTSWPTTARPVSGWPASCGQTRRRPTRSSRSARRCPGRRTW